MSLQKGVQYLLEALASLRLPRFEIWLIGSLLPEIKPFLAKHEGHYRYLGAIPRTELFKYYSQGSVFVIASIQDGFGLVQSQAMACGLPVIASAHTGAEDLFTDGVEGFIVPIRSPEAIRERVLHLYQHPEVRDEMARAALYLAQSLRGWDTYGEQTVTYYQAALAHRRAKRA
jgi:glycosyltransferase involved in cell wall biosynthesis